ncbi:CD9 antigen-like [Tubulanus polymorphus]|uniref:CD9 antigen-like n=1 Tax=Tubulanus polymorphus TaxID=672921 RepID=UPI003DA5C678
MGLGSCFTCIKYLMIAFNFIFWLLGMALLGVGIWLLVDPESTKLIQEAGIGNFYIGAYVMIVVGIIVMVLGFLGYCGAWRESQCMLTTFFVLLLLIFITLVGCGIWAVIKQAAVKKYWGIHLQSLVDNYKNDDTPEKNTDLLNIQNQFNCCGVHGRVDYLPGLGPKPCTQLSTLIKPVVGCEEATASVLKDKLTVVAAVVIGLGVVMLIGLIFSMLLCCAIRDTRG